MSSPLPYQLHRCAKPWNDLTFHKFISTSLKYIELKKESLVPRRTHEHGGTVHDLEDKKLWNIFTLNWNKRCELHAILINCQ